MIGRGFPFLTIVMGALSNMSMIEWVQLMAGMVSITVGVLTVYRFYFPKKK
jgi:hypothetical protein